MGRAYFIFVFISILLVGCERPFGDQPSGSLPAGTDQNLEVDIGSNNSPRRVDTTSIPPTWTPRPASATVVPSTAEETQVSPAAEKTPDAVAESTYVVEEGDTLLVIAIQFDVDLYELAELNGIEDIDHIEVGQVLNIPH